MYMNTKYEFDLLRRLPCPNNNNTNFTADVKQMIHILNKTYEAMATPQPLSASFSITSQSLFLCNWRPPRSMPG